jgi:hypothetical protein
MDRPKTKILVDGGDPQETLRIGGKPAMSREFVEWHGSFCDRPTAGSISKPQILGPESEASQ